MTGQSWKITKATPGIQFIHTATNTRFQMNCCVHSGEEAVPVNDFQFILFVVNVRSGSTNYRKNLQVK